MKHKLEVIKIVGRNINNLRYADDTTLMAESKEKLKSLLMKETEESEKGCLKLNIQKAKIMASGSTTSWHIDRENMETVSDFFFSGTKINVDSECICAIKIKIRHTVSNLDSVLKGRDITLPTKVCIVKAVVFLVVMYGCESWTIKKAERQRIETFSKCGAEEDSLESLGQQGDEISQS